jgi:hypothetical protein
VHERGDRVTAERLEAEQRAAAAQRGVHLEERVLGGGADEGERAVLDRGEQRVLLSLREAVDLVEEQDGALPALAEPLPSTLDHLAHVLDPGGDRAELLERTLGAAGHGEGEGGLAGAGWPPEDRTGEPVLFDQTAQRPPRCDEVLLPDDVVERARTQPGGQRGLGLQALLGRSAEQIAHPPDAIRAARSGPGGRDAADGTVVVTVRVPSCRCRFPAPESGHVRCCPHSSCSWWDMRR